MPKKPSSNGSKKSKGSKGSNKSGHHDGLTEIKLKDEEVNVTHVNTTHAGLIT